MTVFFRQLKKTTLIGFDILERSQKKELRHGRDLSRLFSVTGATHSPEWLPSAKDSGLILR